MGICHAYLSEKTYSDSQWKNTPENSYCYLMQNKQNKNQRLMKWITNKMQDKKIYDWRFQSKEKHMIKLYSIKQTVKPYSLSLITQQLIKIEELTLTLNQAYYIFFQSMQAYLKLVDRMGWFALQQDKIFLDSEGNVKIWINRNLAVNTVQKPIKQNNHQQYFLSHLQILINSKIRGREKIQLPEKYTFHKIFTYLKAKIGDNSVIINTRISILQQKNQYGSLTNPNQNQRNSMNTAINNKMIIQQKKQEYDSDSVSLFPHKIKFITTGNNLNRVRDYSPKPLCKVHNQSYEYNQNSKMGRNPEYDPIWNGNLKESYLVTNSNNYQEQFKRIQSRIVVRTVNEDPLIF